MKSYIQKLHEEKNLKSIIIKHYCQINNTTRKVFTYTMLIPAQWTFS